MKYRSIYACWVVSELREGKAVYALDRKLKQVFTVNEMNVDTAIAMINDAEEHRDRYEFWAEETEENENA